MDRPELYIVAGPSGGGKTSTQKNPSLETLNIDDRAAVLNGGSYVDIPDSVRSAAFKQITQQCMERIDDRKSFATETTLRTTWTDPIIQKAHDAGYNIHVSFLAANDPQIHIDRVMERGGRGGHSAPAPVIEDIYRKSLTNLQQLFNDASTGRIQRLTVADSSVHMAPPREQLVVERGRVVYLSPEISPWLSKSLENTPYAVHLLRQGVEEGRSLSGQPFEQWKNMEALQRIFPHQVQYFHFRHEHPDGVKTYQHNQTRGLLHVHPDGQTLNKHGEHISPAKALESALSPQAEKSNGIEKSKDSGPGFEL